MIGDDIRRLDHGRRNSINIEDDVRRIDHSRII